MAKPIELIAANCFHRVSSHFAAIPKEILEAAKKQQPEKPDPVVEGSARSLLSDIADQAGLPLVLELLKAAGLPCTADEIKGRIQAALDAATKADTAGAP